MNELDYIKGPACEVCGLDMLATKDEKGNPVWMCDNKNYVPGVGFGDPCPAYWPKETRVYIEREKKK
jgi:hypothetical protein